MVNQSKPLLTSSLGHFRWEASVGTWTGCPQLRKLIGCNQVMEATNIGEAFRDAIHFEDRVGFENALVRAFEEDQGFWYFVRLVCPDQSCRWVEARGLVSRDSEGVSIGIKGIVRRLDTPEAGCATCRVDEEHLSFTLAALDAAEWEFDPLSNVSCCSEGIWRIFGYTTPPLDWGFDVFLQHVEQHEREGVASTIRRLTETSERVQFECRIQRHSDGELRWIRVIGLARRTHSGLWIWSFLIRDISLLKASEHFIQHQMARLQKERDVRSLFMADMSHEIRTPLNVLHINLHLLKGRELAASDQQLVDRMARASDTLKKTIDEILEHSRLESGQLTLEDLPFELAPLAFALGEQFSPLAERKGVNLKIEAPMSFESGMIGDSHRLWQIISNLVNNALKFTESGGVTVSIWIAEHNEHAARIRFSVEDTGIGIPEDALSHLFSPFRQADDTISRRYGGTGLGLSIAKRLIEAMGGTLNVESHVGVGSRFWFDLRLPLSHAPKHADLCVSPTKSPIEGLRILAVDDDMDSLQALAAMLENEGGIVSIATNGHLAVEQVRAHPGLFNIVLMDVQMPGLDGLAASFVINSEHGEKAPPVIALTAVMHPADVDRTSYWGITEVITKPPDIQRLIASIQRHANYYSGR
jgi:PAS domain S-box-containing protein